MPPPTRAPPPTPWRVCGCTCIHSGRVQLIARCNEILDAVILTGVGWIAHTQEALYSGWLGFRPIVNTSAPLYAAMKAGFDEYWLRDYHAGVNAVNATTPSHYSVSAFNAYHAAAHALHTMFLEHQPPVYVGSQVRCVHG